MKVESHENKVIASFRKKNIDLIVSTTHDGFLKISFDGKEYNTEVVTHEGKGAYRLLGAAAKHFCSLMGVENVGVTLMDESASEAEKSAQAHKDSYQKEIFSRLDDSAEIEFFETFYYGKSLHMSVEKEYSSSHFKKMLKSIEAVNYSDFFKKYGRVEMDWEGRMKYFIRKSQLADLLAYAAGELEEKEQAEEAAAALYVEKLAELSALAKKTGKKQVVKVRHEECDGSAADCSFDAVYLMIDGDGKQTIERVHTH